MDPFEKPFTHPLPTIVIDIKRTALGKKQQSIDVHRRFKYACDIPEKVGIQRDERKEEQPSQNGGHGIGGEADFNKMMRKVIVSFAFHRILHHHAHELNDHAENRHRQHEAPKEEVLLSYKPDDNPILT